jgi:hypothetical protein
MHVSNVRKLMQEHTEYQEKIIPLLGLMHEDKNTHEMALDLVFRIIGTEMSENLKWTTWRALATLQAGADTRKLQDHVRWITEALFHERAREALMGSIECAQECCIKAKEVLQKEITSLKRYSERCSATAAPTCSADIQMVETVANPDAPSSNELCVADSSQHCIRRTRM